MKGKQGFQKGENLAEKNNNWTENAGYIRKHSFIERRLGKPMKCEHCGNEKLRPRQYHWANIDHKYSRNIEDYIRLCVKCHSKYDVEHNNKQFANKNNKYWGKNLCLNQ